LLVVIDVYKHAELSDRTFYFTNYEEAKGSLFSLPKTKVSLKTSDGRAIVANQGDLPAIGVAIQQTGHLDSFLPDDNYFWLDPGETKTVKVSSCDGLTVEAWNAELPG
jgi:beta-mannosidase